MPLSRDRLIYDGKFNAPMGSCRYDGGSNHLTLDFSGVIAPATWPTHLSNIKDVVGSRGTFNPVGHFSIDSDVSQAVNFKNNDGADISQIKMPIPLSPFVAVDYGLTPVISSSALSQWSTEAFNKFHDQIPEEVSVANFLWELKDIAKMIPKLQKSVSKTASSNFLVYNFGIAPFVGDLKKLIGMREAVEKRIQHLKATAGKPVRSTFSRPIIDESNPVKDVSTPFWPFAGFTWRFRRLNYLGTFSASATILQNLEGLDNQLGTMKAFAAACGFTNPAAIVWEAIPFSFVADWFFHFDQQIGRMNIQPFGGEYSVSDVGYSTKEEWLYEVSQVPFPAYNSPTVLGIARIQRYTRAPGLPLSSVFVTSGTLTPKQQMLSLALLNELRR